MKINVLFTKVIFVLALLLSLGKLQAQSTLALSSAAVPAGGTTTLNLSLASSSSPLAAIQWTVNYPATSVGSLTLTGGPALASAGKSLSCVSGVNSYTCVAWGMNSNTISDGVVATLSVTLSGSTSAPITITNALGAATAGDSTTVTATGGTVSVAGAINSISSVACSPGTLAPSASSTCTVILAGSGGGTINLSSNSANLTVPVSLTIPNGSVNGTFAAVANAFTTDQTAAVTATLNDSSKTATLSLVTPLIVSSTSASAISASGATITWTTNKASDSQLAYGATSAYGSASALDSSQATFHRVDLTGLAPSTTYHYKAMSRCTSGTTADSGDFILTTSSASESQPLLLLHSDASEVNGVTNGSVVTPAVAPSGFTGKVVSNGGLVNFAAAQTGNGVYFQNCCSNTNNAYYKFTGPTVGNIFNVNQGQITFYLKSRYSFAQRQASASAPRYAFDVVDGNDQHLFYFLTQVTGGYLFFNYAIAGSLQYAYLPQGTEDAQFGNGVVLKVKMTWDGSVTNLYLNDTLVKSAPYTIPAAKWTDSSVFDLGAHEYQTYGGFNTLDDVIDEFSVTGPALASDTAPPVVSMTAPVNGATITGTVTVSANATDNVGITGVQFQLDGVNLGGMVTGTGPSYSYSWDTTLVADGAHTLTATASDAAGKKATSSISVTVSKPVLPVVISSVAAGSVSSSGASITWNTDKASNSQVAYGTTSSYGSVSALDTTLVSSHTVVLTGLTPSTMYHYQVQSQAALGGLASSADFTFTTLAAAPSGSQPLLLLHSDASEVSGVTNGSIVTPAIAPSGFTGKVVSNGGLVNFAAAQTGNGVYFQNCCSNTNNAYYKFTGTTVGNIFNVNQGQITFYLKSRYSFAQRQASASAPRYAFDVVDGNDQHLFYFLTQVTGGYLFFNYAIAGSLQYVYLPQGTEDAQFGNGVVLKVKMTWDGSVTNLYLNDTLVKSAPYTIPAAKWTGNSVFDLGAHEYQNYGGFNTLDDVVDEFTVTGPVRSPAVLTSSASMSHRNVTDATVRPVITSLQNGASEAAPAACSPEAIASLAGHFLSAGAEPLSDRSGKSSSLGEVGVLVNGSYVPVLYASSDRVDFLCPAVPPSTSLSIAVETPAGLSNRVETKVEEASPGIFAPVVLAPGTGDTVSLRVTGMNWLAKFSTVRPFVRIGTQYVPIGSITPDPQNAGVSTITVTLPSDIAGEVAPAVIEVVKTDGRSVSSNLTSLGFEAGQSEGSHPLIKD